MIKYHSWVIKTVTFFTFSISASFAQNDADIYKFSKTYHGGSARFEAMGGAFGALGADISAVQINPAAMGRFSSSQFSISMAPLIASSAADFAGTNTKAVKSNFVIPSIGLVFTKDLSTKNKGDMYSQFAFGMNRIANFNQRMVIEGQQYPSLLDNFMGQAYGYYPEELATYFPFTTSVAYEAYAIDYNDTDVSYYSYLNTADVKMSREVINKGGINEFFLSYSRNRMNKLYYGVNLNIRSYNSEEKYIHSEDLTVVDSTFLGFDYSYTLKTSGTGANLKLGAIYLVTDGFRLGLSVHSPTIISLHDKWTADMTSRFETGKVSLASDLVPTGEYKYRMTTPFKAIFSSSYVIGMAAIISGDLEYIGYQMGKLKSTRDITFDPYDFKLENNEAKLRLTNAINFRLGAEFNIQQALFLRAGFSFYGNAYKKSEDVDPIPDLGYSAGIGYKKDRFSIDLAYVNRQLSRKYYPFAGSEIATTRSTLNSIVVTGTIRF